MEQTIQVPHKGVKLIAHRGLSGLYPENTLKAFAHAAECSYYGIETDVHRTADGKYIIIHDDTTERVAGDQYTVEETDFETLRSLRITADPTLQLPLPEEYFAICKSCGKAAVYELKNPMAPVDVAEIYQMVKDAGYLEHTVFISFDLNNLLFLRALDPNVSVQYLLGKRHPENLLELVKQYRLDLDVYHKVLTPEMVAAFHEAGALVNCWTVDTPEAAAHVLACGVDFITTNILE